MFRSKLITSKLHKNGLMALTIACVVASLLLRKPIARQMNQPIVKMLAIACIAAMTYLSPLIGCILAGCFIYVISAFGFMEGFEDKEDGADEEEDEDQDEEDDMAD
jgi:hypothetical protein